MGSCQLCHLQEHQFWYWLSFSSTLWDQKCSRPEWCMYSCSWTTDLPAVLSQDSNTAFTVAHSLELRSLEGAQSIIVPPLQTSGSAPLTVLWKTCCLDSCFLGVTDRGIPPARLRQCGKLGFKFCPVYQQCVPIYAPIFSESVLHPIDKRGFSLTIKIILWSSRTGISSVVLTAPFALLSSHSVCLPLPPLEPNSWLWPNVLAMSLID